MAVIQQAPTPAPASPAHRISAVSPLHVVAALIGALVIRAAAGPLNDYDSFLHVQLGGQILAEHRVTDLPSWWLAGPAPANWTTSQWLAEVLMHLIVTGAGWPALIAVRVLLAAALVVALAFTLLRGHPARVGVPVFVLTLAVVSGVVQDRPQTAGLFFLVWLGPACVRLWTTGQRPPIALVALGSLLWAQLHGSWILLPLAFALTAAGLQLEAWSRRPAPHLRAALVCVVASLAGVLNPHGLDSFLLPSRFSDATATITEWWPTTLASGFTLAWAGLIMVVVGCWARSGLAVSRAEMLWVLAWAAFGMTSYRNVAPAALLMAPVAVAALARLLDRVPAGTPSAETAAGEISSAGSLSGEMSSRTTVPAGIRAGSGEARVLSLVCVLLVVGATIGALVRVPAVDPFATTPGARIAAWVAAQPGPVRVFNNWNAGGALIGLSDGKARLVIDGRADLWGGAYTQKIDDAGWMRPGWRRTLDDFAPDAVVMPSTNALVSGLTADGWHVELTDGKLVLLLPDNPPVPTN